MRLVLLAVVAMVRIAAADPAAEKLFRDGKQLKDAGKLVEACDSFARSQRLEPKVGTLLNLADCHDRQGHTATAWSLYLEAKALALQVKDRRAALAGQLAAKLEPRLAYVTLTLAPERQVDGLAITRNGAAVDPAVWNQAVPLDPGDYVIEATAPRYQTWSTRQVVGRGDRVTVMVEALRPAPPDAAEPPTAPSPTAPPPTGPPAAPVAGVPRAAALPAGPVPALRPVGFGVAVGATDESDTLVGVRALGGIAVPHGALRGIASLLYTKFLNDPTDPENSTSLYALGVSADYVWMPVPHFALAAGIGVGLDYASRTLDQGSDTSPWGTLRASPIIVRLLRGHVELGVHVQLVRTGDNTVFLGVAAIDLFPW